MEVQKVGEKIQEKLSIEDSVNEKNEDNITSNNGYNQKKLILQNDNINLIIENSSKNSSSKEKIKIVNKNNNNQKVNVNINKAAYSLLQEKLKNIFLEREKAKLKYNKQDIPDQLKYTSDDDDSNFSKELIKFDNKNKNIANNSNIDNNKKEMPFINAYKERKIEEKNSNQENKNYINEKNENIKEDIDKDGEVINNKIDKVQKIDNERFNNQSNDINNLESRDLDVKSFKRKKNFIKNEEDDKNQNLYQLLLSKKMKNIVYSNEDNNNNNSKTNKIIENKNNENEMKQIESKDNKENNLIKNIKETKIENKKLSNKKEENEKMEEKREDIEEKEKEEKGKIIDNKTKNENNEEEKEDSNELEINFRQNNNYQNLDLEQYQESKYCSKTFKNTGVIQLNQNINYEKMTDRVQKGTELPTPQKNRLTINLKSHYDNENMDVNDKELLPEISPRDSKIKNEKPKTINRYENSPKKLEENIGNSNNSNKSNILKLLQLIKNKKNEKEKIEKEKEKAKEEMYQRSKSQAVSRNMETIHKLKDKLKEKENEKNSQNAKTNSEIKVKVNINFNRENEIKNNIGNNSPKIKIYNKKNKFNNNKYISNSKSKEKDFDINIEKAKYLEIQKNCSPKSGNISKQNSKFWSSNKNKKMERIVVNHRMKKSNTKYNTNFKTNKNKKKEKKDEIEINFNKNCEKKTFIYNKHHLPNRSIDFENNDNVYSNQLPNNSNRNEELNALINNINYSVKVYNPKKGHFDKGKSVDKLSNNINLNNKLGKEYCSNRNNYIYNYNYNNYLCNNNNVNNIYVKKKTFLIESNVDTNTSSSCNLSKSINNPERNKKYFSINNKKDNMRMEQNYYSNIPKGENLEQNLNLKVNKKSFYLNDNNQNINNVNESADIVGRSFITDAINNNYTKNLSREKIDDKYDSYIGNKNDIVQSYNEYINNNINNINSNQTSRKLGLQKYCNNRKDILMDYGEDNNSFNNLSNYYSNDTSRKINEQKKINSLKIEDFLVIEEKLNSIIECLKKNKDINKQCFDLWNFRFNSSIFKKIEKIFYKEKEIIITKLSINYELISLIICYEYSIDQDIYMDTYIKLLEIMEINYNNLMRVFQQIINIIRKDNQENIWKKKLIYIFENFSKKEDFFLYNEDIVLTIEKIKNNNENLNIKIQNILNCYQTENNTLLLNYFLQLKTMTYEDLNTFFQKNILQIENPEGSLIASLYLRNHTIFSPVPPPYLKTQNTKKYTLVLDLDETLVNFKIKKGREGYVRLRPFLFGFLEEVSQYYELIIFTSATEAYANSVIEAIEHDKKYFDYIFYRQHTIIVGNDFVKDLTRIGRPLNSTIIIDNMPQNFRFQKENGICIKPFWGQDSNDKTLYDLMPILLDIAKNGGDVRISLNTYKDEIMGKITSNISKKAMI